MVMDDADTRWAARLDAIPAGRTIWSRRASNVTKMEDGRWYSEAYNEFYTSAELVNPEDPVVALSIPNLRLALLKELATDHGHRYAMATTEQAVDGLSCRTCIRRVDKLMPVIQSHLEGNP